MNAFIRFRLALTEDKPTIKPYNETEWAKLADMELDPRISIQILDGLHQRWHAMLLAMKPTPTSRAPPCIRITGRERSTGSYSCMRGTAAITSGTSG